MMNDECRIKGGDGAAARYNAAVGLRTRRRSSAMHSGKPNVEVASRQARRWQELSLILAFLWVAFCSGLSFASRADRGGDDGRVASGRGGIEGVVGETRRVADRDYATISGGTEDGVRKNMRLAIVGPRGELLGSITVTGIDPEES